MTKEQFQQVAEAYGGELMRWPVGLRDEAALLMAAEPEFVRRVLAREAQLDTALDELVRGSPASTLCDLILANAPAGRSHSRWGFWIAPTAVGGALAGIAAAGVLVGAHLGERAAARSDDVAQSLADLDVFAVAGAG